MLVGTTSVERSEALAAMLQQEGGSFRTTSPLVLAPHHAASLWTAQQVPGGPETRDQYSPRQDADGLHALLSNCSARPQQPLSALSHLTRACRHQVRAAEREAGERAAGGRDCGAERPEGLCHHLHQHGRPRHRHPAGRQPRVYGQGATPLPYQPLSTMPPMCPVATAAKLYAQGGSLLGRAGASQSTA